MRFPRRLPAWLRNRVWSVHQERVLLVRATPAVCLHTLAQAARPSTKRLHLRNLFLDGRRYYLTPSEDGFQMRSTTRVPWRRRRRGRVASILEGSCSEMTEGVTRIDLRAHIAPLFLLDVFVLPGWMSLLLIFGPLPAPVGVASSLLVLALSWAWHWYSAVLQATEMFYFVQVALDDLPAAAVHELPNGGDNVIYADFQQEWQKFYDEHRR